MNDVLYNGVLYTIDGEVLCEFPEFKIDWYKDKTVIKIHCTNCCVVEKFRSGSLTAQNNASLPQNGFIAECAED